MNLLARLNSFQPFKVLVVGDFMLDQYVSGAAERLSPDAPVPVLQATRSEDHPGGAANVSRCLRAIDAEVYCIGIVGADREAEILCKKLIDEGCDVAGLLRDNTRPTTVKKSFIGLAQHRHPQKMFRVDVESKEPICESLLQELLTAIEKRLDDVDVVCIEDYNKGVCSKALCSQLIEWCRKIKKPVLVDPAAIDDYSKYTGATAVTPNRSEAELATGLDTPLDASEIHNAGLARKLLHDLDVDAVVLTLDRHGALLEERGGEPILVPTIAREVYDVTGAGDMVLAALAGAVANGFSWPEAVNFANAAAGLEVEVFGVQPIRLSAIRREVLIHTNNLDGKIRGIEELLIELAVHCDAGKRIVFTNGCFDVIHAGHVAYLREAKQSGDILVVAVNDDAQVRMQKGEGRPIYTEAERLDILSELQCIDYLILFDQSTVHDLLKQIVPDVYVKGGDYQPEQINEYDLVRELGIELRIVCLKPGLGSTDVIERVKNTCASK